MALFVEGLRNGFVLPFISPPPNHLYGSFTFNLRVFLLLWATWRLTLALAKDPLTRRLPRVFIRERI